jgi:competence protein ComEC
VASTTAWEDPAPAEAAARPAPHHLTRAERAWLVGLLAGAVALMLLWAGVIQQPDRRLHLRVLDVGQGDALLLTTPAGHTILVDGGPDAGRTVSYLGRYLPFWQRRIDLLVLTHPHEDHLGGLVEVAARYEIGQVLETPYTLTNTLETAWMNELQAQHLPTVAAVRGMIVEVEPDLALHVLAPDRDLLRGTHSDINNSSVVLRLEYRQVSMLLAGDIESEAGGRLLSEANAGLPLAATVLKVPHHGSASGLSDPLLAAIHPQLALISVGAGNGYGHPAPATLAALATAHTPVYRTDQHGTIDVSSDGAHLWVQTER